MVIKFDLPGLRQLGAELGFELVTPSKEDKGEYDRVTTEIYTPEIKIGLIKDGELAVRPRSQKSLLSKMIRAVQRKRNRNHIRHTQETYGVSDKS